MRRTNGYLEKRQARQRKEDRQGYLMIAGCCAVVGLGVAGLIWNKPIPRDVATGCPKGLKATVQHVAVVDRTEKWTERNGALLREALENLAESLKTDERVSLVAFDGDDQTKVDLLFDRCRPPEGKDVNAAVATPSRVDKAFRTTFREPLRESFAHLTTQHDAKESHLVGFLSNLVATLKYRNEADALVLHLFSDMGEHTQTVSLLGTAKRKSGDTTSFVQYFANHTQGRFQNLELNVHVVPTPSSKGAVSDTIRTAWSEAFTSAGVRFTWAPL